jgi:RimJ/RimL family protein N-acetyltransferase
MEWPGRITVDDRLILRPWRVDEAEALHDAVQANLDHLRPWMPWAADEPRDVAWREQWIRDTNDGTVGIFGIDDETVLGGTGLHERIGEGGVEIGYWVDARHTGRGIATCVAAALTQLAFAVGDYDRVEIHCDEANVASAAIPRHLGFALISITDDEVAAPGECGRDMVWRMTRDMYASSAVSVVHASW